MGVMKAEIQSIQWKKCFQRGYENRNSVNHVEKVSSLAYENRNSIDLVEKVCSSLL